MKPTAPISGRQRDDGFVFYLGTHHVAWLEQTDVPLFISQRTLARRRSLPRARGPWALDSGGFTELAMHGRWTIAVREYTALARRARDEVAGLAWAAIQDWMCEASILRSTGLSVAEHQRRTLASYLELRSAAPDIEWLPVLQGWTRGDYLNHLDDYARAGVDLPSAPAVGVGSVCRRQHTLRASLLISELAELGLRLHAFGFKVVGLASSWTSLASSDSLAWSLNARRNPSYEGCSHRRCSNCLRFALSWRADLLARLEDDRRASAAHLATPRCAAKEER